MVILTLIFLSSALLGWFINIPVVWLLKVFRLRQFVRQEGPSSHLQKAGTPTMAGIGIILTIVILALIWINVDLSIKFASALALMLGFSLLGFLDDILKVRKRQNTGLIPSEKFLGQVLFSIVFAAVLIYLGHSDSVTGVLRDLNFNNPYVYLVFVVFAIVGAGNAVNLTDGLDGLAAGLLAIAFAALGAVALRSQLMISDEAILCMIAGGAAFAFLRVNFHPAEVFMGDVGSLGLGAFLAAMAILLHKELLLVMIGGVFVLETLSVILQVTSYKLFRFRIFKMSPLHHHFELSGVQETVIVLSFYAAGLIFAALGVWLYNAF